VLGSDHAPGCGDSGPHHREAQDRAVRKHRGTGMRKRGEKR
jgi:hypothetical protein